MNIMRTMTSLLSRLHKAGTQSVNWMAPSHNGCVVCGKDVGQSQSTQARFNSGSEAARMLNRALCRSCLSAIPWLDRIICPTCGRAIHCEDCGRRPNRHFVLNRSAVSYDPVMRSWLALYKYRGLERLAPLLAEMMVPPLRRLTEELAKAEPHAPDQRKQGAIKQRWSMLKNRNFSAVTSANSFWDAVTFVPISAQRAEERGFNQAEEMARHLSSRFGIPLCDLLVRAHHSEKMSFKSRTERMRAAKSLFEINEASFRRLESSLTPARELRILLVDDIYTTGSTVDACSEVLLRHARFPLRVYVLTWSRS